jgi:hypothetical protein
MGQYVWRHFTCSGRQRLTRTIEYKSGLLTMRRKRELKLSLIKTCRCRVQGAGWRMSTPYTVHHTPYILHIAGHSSMTVNCPKPFCSSHVIKSRTLRRTSNLPSYPELTIGEKFASILLPVFSCTICNATTVFVLRSRQP